MDGAFGDPGIPDGERTAYRGTVRGRETGSGVVTIRASDEAYVQALSSQVEGAIRYEMETRFLRRPGSVIAESYRLRTLQGDRQIALEEGQFRDVSALHWGGELRPYPRSITPLLPCSLALRGLEFEPGAERTFAIWLANTVYWEVHLRVERRERLAVPAGSFEAWRVRARPSFHEIAGALDRLIAMLLPPFVLHFGAEPPHRFLRFEFPTGPFPWNPRATVEASQA